MARDGSGNYSLPAGNPVVTGTTINSTTHNNTTADIASALTQSLARDGQTSPTSNLKMDTYKHTNVGNATARNQYASAGQAQDGDFLYLSSVSGADTITAVSTPAITAYAEGQTFRFVADDSNTGATTININSIGAKSIKKAGTTALLADDIVSGAMVEISYDGTNFQLLNPNLGRYLPLRGGQMASTSAIQWAGAQALLQNDTRINCTNLAGDAQVPVTAGNASGVSDLIALGQTLGQLNLDSGYIQIPIWDGAQLRTVIIQWVKGTQTSTIAPGATVSQTIDWPTPFPNFCLFAQASNQDPSPNLLTCNLVSKGASNCAVSLSNPSANSYPGTPAAIGIGY